ncbi:septal ring lytic transglycosylase RlpA family protein [Pseudodesulfovibrio sp. zrk46]|uniref:septal ring lytic transglycosylase RlpA family protein n=1 Tax=Pseudodesulfovibrio sp. zrk46 TaxID=2725288 RepID=UPI001449ED98|nr:septal ring lytic transglycosylase RlpA family protein [Pseudodesulfovibrio sp. zrk46]QJB55055.1 septal ring lytic transglycosylase RlpA family protein [Pseudodesulfovibrio sp. zrk46]
MRHAIVLLAMLAVLVMTGCASINPFSKRIYSTPPRNKPTTTTPGSYDPKTRPYTVLGKTYYPLQTAVGYDQVGMASWYGEDFHGKKTANGYIYDMYGISAAHKTLPLGTQVRVTNLENNRSVILVVNDRGPFVNGRILDLSYGAAKKLDSVNRGVVKVRITAIGTVPYARKTNPAAAVAVKSFHVRVGAFSDRENAERTHRRLVSIGYKEANIKTEMRNGRRLHIVQAGSYSSRDKAERVQRALSEDFPTCYIVS